MLYHTHSFSFHLLFCFCHKITAIYSSCSNRISHFGIVIFPCVEIVFCILIVCINNSNFWWNSIDICIPCSELIHNSFHYNHSFLFPIMGSTIFSFAYLDVGSVILNDDFPFFHHLVDVFFRDAFIKHIRKELINVLHRSTAIIPIFIEDWCFSI